MPSINKGCYSLQKSKDGRKLIFKFQGSMLAGKNSEDKPMEGYHIQSIHTGEELIKLENKRKCAEEILKTVHAQKNLQGGKKETKEEFVTRYLRQHKQYLLTEEEIIIFDQYPLWKQPAHPMRVDLIYMYKCNNSWSLGIVEAKIEGGDGLMKTIKEQLQPYERLIRKRFDERIKSFQVVVKHKFGIELPIDCQFTRLDILAPSDWWNEQKRKEPQALHEMKKLNIRALCIPDNYLPRDDKPIDVPVRQLDIS